MTDDADLQAIRARRLAQLRAQGVAGGAAVAGNGVPATQEDAEQRRQNEEMRRNILHQILSTEARERLSRIAMVKADRAKQVEDMLIGMARMGRLGGKVSEEMLISLLGQVQDSGTKITFSRRREYGLEED